MGQRGEPRRTERRGRREKKSRLFGGGSSAVAEVRWHRGLKNLIDFVAIYSGDRLGETMLESMGTTVE